ncbi:cytochrome c biogenesis CcdA family protein [Micromonosporaceae bacterium Da 78-11]
MSLLIVGEDPARTPGASVALRRALWLTAAMTVGFVIVFAAFGLLAAPAADWIAQRLPWLTVIIGVVLAFLGGWLLAGRELPSPVPRTSRAPALRRTSGSMILFGMSFAVASLGCTIGPFLGVVVASFTTGSALQGIGLFVAYAAGMALIVASVSVAVALARQTVIAWLRRTAGVVSRVAGALMAFAGLYVAWYGWYEIRIQANPATTDPIIDTAETVQITLSSSIENIGTAGITVALIAASALLAIVVRARRPSRHD